MEGLEEVLGSIVALIFLALPFVSWLLFSALGRARRRARRRRMAEEAAESRAPSAPARATPPPDRLPAAPAPESRRPREEPENWIARIRGQEASPITMRRAGSPEEKPEDEFRSFESFREFSSSAELGLLDDETERPLTPEAAELPGLRATEAVRRSRPVTVGVGALPSLKRAVVWAEILGPPAALRDPEDHGGLQSGGFSG